MIKNTIAIITIALSLGLSGCQPNTPAQDTQDLYQYKTAYVGDNSKVSAIVSLQSYPEGVKTDGIEILSAQEPYGLKVFLITHQKVNEVDLVKNAIITFALIENLYDIYYVNKNDDTIIVQFDRSSCEKELRATIGKSLDEIGASPESLETLINYPKYLL